MEKCLKFALIRPTHANHSPLRDNESHAMESMNEAADAAEHHCYDQHNFYCVHHSFWPRPVRPDCPVYRWCAAPHIPTNSNFTLFYFTPLIHSFIYYFAFRVHSHSICPLVFNWATIYSHLNLNHSLRAHSIFVFVLFLRFSLCACVGVHLGWTFFFLFLTFSAVRRV